MKTIKVESHVVVSINGQEFKLTNDEAKSLLNQLKKELGEVELGLPSGLNKWYPKSIPTTLPITPGWPTNPDWPSTPTIWCKSE